LKEDIAAFDAPFFNISPLEAKVCVSIPEMSAAPDTQALQAMDPQQRLQLETAYEALENGMCHCDSGNIVSEVLENSWTTYGCCHRK
jgi:hypothetical protein